MTRIEIEKGAHVDTTTDIIKIRVGIVHEGSIILLLVLIHIATIAIVMTANMMILDQRADHNGMASMYSDFVCLASITTHHTFSNICYLHLMPLPVNGG